MKLDRRQLNFAALAWALAPWSRSAAQSGTAPLPGAPRWQSNPFSLGVASGMPRPDSVVLWTRLLGNAGSSFEAENALSPGITLFVSYEIYSNSALTQLVQKGSVQTSAERAFSVHVTLNGLASGREYFYRFRCGNAVSPVGRTRTAPAPDAAPGRLRIALASCQHFEQGYYSAHRDIAAQDLDFVLFVGDYIYESSNPRFVVSAARRHAGRVPKTLDEYRARHAQYKSDVNLQAAHAAHPWALTWDDHEVCNDYANDQDPARTDPQEFLKRRAAAYRAYFEHMPLALGPDAAAGGQGMRIYDRMAWGQLADVWTLDCRQYRSYHACQNPLQGGGRQATGCAELADLQRSMLGQEQENWLTQGLKSSSTHKTGDWKIIAQSTQISSSGLDATGAAGSTDTSSGRSVNTDAWDGYPHARSRLLQTIADAKLADVVTLGGDVHRNVAAQLRLRPNDSKSPIVASELVCTSVTSHGGNPKTVERMLRSNPDIAYARTDERGYCLLTVTPQQMACDFRATQDAEQADAVLQTSQRYVVERGRAGVQKA
ncbi:MAG: alkaline phosphatase D family protein [Polaromonas sp.]|nr:alkaline phosphatase D family protein [Polaromonas sp.]